MTIFFLLTLSFTMTNGLTSGFLVSHNHMKTVFMCSQPQQSNQQWKSKACAIYTTSSICLLSQVVFSNLDDNSKRDNLCKDLFAYIKSDEEVLEIGFGDGANADYYPRSIGLVALDPYLDVGKIDKNKYERKNINLKISKESAEALPFPSNNFDVVVSTLVFCTISNPKAALVEVFRVLKPGGRFICVEHIHADENTLLGLEQSVLDPLQQILANGCHLSRRTDLLLKSYVEGSDITHETPSSIPRFSKVLRFDVMEFPSQWPISKQIFVALEK